MGRMKDFALAIETAIANNPNLTDREIASIVMENCRIDVVDFNYVVNNVQRYRIQQTEEGNL